jgi:hypothetical protein
LPIGQKHVCQKHIGQKHVCLLAKNMFAKNILAKNMFAYWPKTCLPKTYWPKTCLPSMLKHPGKQVLNLIFGWILYINFLV